MFAGFGSPEDTNAALPPPAGAGADRPVDGLRHALADGLRPRPPALGGRGRARGRLGGPRRRHVRRLFDGIDLSAVSTSMTISGPAPVALALFVAAAEARACRARHLSRHAPDRHPQGVHRPEGVDRPRAPLDAPGGRPDRLLRGRDAALAPDLGLGLPHPRGGVDGGAGAGLHDRRRPRLRRADLVAPRGRSRQLPAALLVLLQLPHRLLRGDRQAARRAPPLGEPDARAVGRQGPAVVAAAHPRADLGRVAVRPAAAAEHRPHRDRGARRGILAGTQSLHTNAYDETLLDPDRGVGDPRAAHPADHRGRDRRRERGRPARRVVVRRAADRRDGGRGARVPGRRSTSRGGMVAAVEAGLPAGRDRRGLVHVPARLRGRASASSSASTPSRGPDEEEPHRSHRADPEAERMQIERVHELRAPARRQPATSAHWPPLAAACEGTDNVMPHLVEPPPTRAPRWARSATCSARPSRAVYRDPAHWLEAADDHPP